MDPQTANTLESVSGLAIEVYLAGGLMLVGLVLLLAGRKLARASCVLVGLTLGSAAGAALGQFFGLSSMMLVGASLIGALGGALFAGFLFRAFVAVTGAALLAAVVPCVVLLWQGTPPPAVDLDDDTSQALLSSADETASDLINDQLAQTTRAQVQEIVSKVRDAIQSSIPYEEGAENSPPTSDDSAEQASDDQAGSMLTETASRMLEALREALSDQEESLRAWWDQLTPALKGTVLTGSLIGAVVGLLLGLLMPHTASSIESSMLGSVLIYLPGTRLLAQFAPAIAASLPTGPRGTLVVLGLITLAGVAFQWTLFRKKADR
ncbi:MAG: hypothetical protein RLN76_00270 [Phycisphaeraceae bacterium]